MIQWYLILFILLIVGGETFLIPAIYSGLYSTLSLSVIIGLALAATMISDTVWFFLGRAFAVQAPRLKRLQRISHQAEKFKPIMRTHGIPALLISKFVYGTRIAVQAASGYAGMSYRTYAIANLAAVLIWILFLVAIIISIRKSLDALQLELFVAHIAAVVIVLIVMILILLINKFILKKWLR